MKRKILAIAIPALLAASAAQAAEIYNKDGNKVDVYGRVYALNYVDNGSKTKIKGDDGDKTSVRLGVNGQTQISDTLTGYGKLEIQRDTGKGGKSETRYGYAGLRFGNYGSIDYGRNDGVAKSVLSYAAIAPEFGGDTKDADLYMTDRTDSVLTYRANDLFGMVKGLNIALQYQDSNGHKANDTKSTGNGEGWGSSVEYSILDTGVTVGIAYTNSQRSPNDKVAILGYSDGTVRVIGLGKRAEMATFGVKYDANNLYVAAMYSDSRNMLKNKNGLVLNGIDTNGITTDKARTYELAVSYGIELSNGAKFTPALSYLYGKDHSNYGNLGSANKAKDLFKYIDLGATYDFNKNMTAIIDYKLNLLKKPTVAGNTVKSTKYSDTLALGLIYRF